jgi:predicted N-formylglutamate amidohydrolase
MPSEAHVGNAGSLVAVLNRHGSSGLILICEHASNYIPPAYRRLGLASADLRRHIAWDIGALVLAQHLSARLDAPLIYASHSRLLLDLNRDPAAADSIVEHSEDTPIPGNVGLSTDERQHRRQWLYEPFHRELGRIVDHRLRTATPTALLSVHSFTPSYRGEERPWKVGVVSGSDRRLADPLLVRLREEASLTIGDNQPYAAADGVYHTLQRHAESRGLASVLLEVRNDQIQHAPGRSEWAERLEKILKASLAEVLGAANPMSSMHSA